MLTGSILPTTALEEPLVMGRIRARQLVLGANYYRDAEVEGSRKIICMVWKMGKIFWRKVVLEGRPHHRGEDYDKKENRERQAEPM